MEQMTKEAESKKKESEKSEKKVTLKSIVMNLVPGLLKKHKDGMKYADILNEIIKAQPSATRNSAHGCVWNLLKNDWKGMLVISKGIYKLKNGKVLESKNNNKK